MRKYINLGLLIIVILFASCEKFLEPQPDGTLTNEELLFNPTFAEGLLMTAYAALPNEYDFATDVASDDAVTNEKESDYRRMASGEWLSSFNPISKWSDAYLQISYINRFLSIYQSVKWSTDPNLSKSEDSIRNFLHSKRLNGEAHALRAYYKWMLLQYHAGKAADGQILGYIIINDVMEPSQDWKLPRNTFAECITDIFNDLDTAIVNLPAEWVDGVSAAENATIGARFQNRINGNTARAIRARVALLAASPAFAESNAVSWSEAATIAGDLLSDLGSLYNKGIVFYQEKTNKEILWNRAEIINNLWEQENFPPSLFGLGQTNPSQNLVDAFPMSNGYPLTDPLSGYDPDHPFLNRDSRLSSYIIYNGSKLKNSSVETYVGAEQNGINDLVTSTRSGYYLKKLMNEAVSLTPGSSVNAGHTYTLVRMTELLLNYAEAANEAWGPDGDPNGYGFTAKSKIGELRSRAGISSDGYLNSMVNQADMRALIRNERRIELCFEGFRFWDIRRWKDISTMTSPVKGAYITMESDSSFTYSYSNIEERIFTPDMIYGPIPYDETLKYDIEQNAGW